MYTPTLQDVKKLSNRGNLVPVYREINADLETPISAYLKVAQSPYSFLLESVEGGHRLARYSFIGTEPYGIIKTGSGQPGGESDPLTHIETELSQYKLISLPGIPRFLGGAIGYLSYDAVNYFEPRVPKPHIDSIGVPESVFMLTDTLLVFDHVKQSILVVSHVRIDKDVEKSYKSAIQRIETLVDRLKAPLDHTSIKLDPQTNNSTKPTSNITKKKFFTMVNKIKKYIEAGDVIQVVISQRWSRKTIADPLHIYRALRAINPSPYMYYLNLDGFQIIGASPEMLVQAEDGVITTHPVAGTRPRGANEEEDKALAKELLANEKEKAEHIMLVDLGRNDIGRVSQPGTVTLPKLMDVEKYSHVMHIVSHVVGRLNPDTTAYDAMRACFPAGTLSGAPKIRAMEIISELENQTRGPYGGAIGYFSFSGNMDTAIAIRTIVLKDGIASVQSGAGIVSDSVPESEYEETVHKAGALLRAIDTAERSPF